MWHPCLIRSHFAFNLVSAMFQTAINVVLIDLFWTGIVSQAFEIFTTLKMDIRSFRTSYSRLSLPTRNSFYLQPWFCLQIAEAISATRYRKILFVKWQVAWRWWMIAHALCTTRHAKRRLWHQCELSRLLRRGNPELNTAGLRISKPSIYPYCGEICRLQHTA